MSVDFGCSGPEHMRGFVEDKSVQAKFKETCLSRSVTSLPGPNSGITYNVKHLKLSLLAILGEIDSDDDGEDTKPKIQLFSAHVEDYTGDVLTLLLPRIMNPHGTVFMNVVMRLRNLHTK